MMVAFVCFAIGLSVVLAMDILRWRRAMRDMQSEQARVFERLRRDSLRRDEDLALFIEEMRAALDKRKDDHAR